MRRIALGLLLLAGVAPAQLLGPLQQQQFAAQTPVTGGGYSLSNGPATSVPSGSPLGDNGYGLPQQGVNPARQGDPISSSSLMVGASSLGALGGPAGEHVVVVPGTRDELLDQERDEIERGALQRPLPPALPGEFERYVDRIVGHRVARLGANLLLPPARGFAAAANVAVPADYRLRAGDRIDLFLTGSVEAQLRLAIDADGRLQVPKVGAVAVAGTRYGELRALLARALGREYRNFEVSVSAAPQRLRGIRVYVTGFAQRPGAYAVNALSTLSNAVLAAGGPTAGGSYRSIELRRAGRLVTSFDLYDLLLRGDTSRDVALEDGDVLAIAPVGAQVAVTGSVNGEAVIEMRPGETIAEAVRYAGGLGSVADPSRAIIARLADLDGSGWRELPYAEAIAAPLHGGDILRILSRTDFARPRERQALLVTIEGEVGKPGHYYLPPGSTLADALALAGGTTAHAFPFGTEFTRVSVREQQRRGLQDALDEVELSVTAAPLRVSAGDGDQAARAAQAAAARQYIDRLRQQQPQGRVVLDLAADASALPGALALENDDRIYVPPRPTTASVFGAVYRPGSFLVGGRARIADLIDQAGGAQRTADRGELFVVRANGAVLTRRKGALAAAPLAGDVVFVPLKTQANSTWSKVRDVASIVLGLGVTGATIGALTK